jgi:23S rRNA pseudouridine2605 synthase
LGRYLAHAGVASRRAAERLIAEGRVTVDGRIETNPATDVDAGRSVHVNGRAVTPETLEYHALNKPVGVISTADDPQGRPTVTAMVGSPARLYPVGRLDVDSSGLVLLTNDGELANRLMHPRYEVPKTYRIAVRGVPSQADLRALRHGVELEDGLTAPARVDVVSQRGRQTLLEMTIHEGRKRILRRMLEAVGHPAVALERTAVGPLRLGRLAVGSVRRLRPAEVTALRRAAGLEGDKGHNPRP